MASLAYAADNKKAARRPLIVVVGVVYCGCILNLENGGNHLPDPYAENKKHKSDQNPSLLVLQHIFPFAEGGRWGWNQKL
jgi:hypothetical protein